MTIARTTNAQHPTNAREAIQTTKGGQAHPKKQEKWPNDELND
jgi:hypothetical protein